ncbi:Protein of unknown function [Pyronema omphalodes CBS 100304]|uniref:Uncharacterized protein n=1 Tax=Pyronema omphalodes (strain CBS 100304) TaxID=1076935 RepID=U4L250_PYROM|nr:Protein of unknown function [Pyronema omphalodes CBS 100304]
MFLEQSRKNTESFILNTSSGKDRNESGLSFWKAKQQRMIKDIRKIKWSMFNAEDARILHQRMQSHVTAFHLFLTALNAQTQARTQRTTNQAAVTARNINDKVDKTLEVSLRTEKTLCEMVDQIKIIMGLDLPRNLGYAWE